MNEKVFDKYGIKQIGYYVESIDESAAIFSRLFGAGPFIDMGVSPLKSVEVRGEEQPVEMRTAIGQMGGMQIELIEVKSDCPDPYKEMGHYGFHHYCIWVDDMESAIREFESEGCSVAMRLESGQGLQVVYMDGRAKFGHYIELNAPLEQLWQAAAALHENWEGEEALIGMEQFMKMMQR